MSAPENIIQSEPLRCKQIQFRNGDALSGGGVLVREIIILHCHAGHGFRAARRDERVAVILLSLSMREQIRSTHADADALRVGVYLAQVTAVVPEFARAAIRKR